MSLIPCLTNSSPAVSLYAPAGSGGGGGGGGVDPAGISTNQVATAFGTTLRLEADTNNVIEIDSSKGGNIGLTAQGAIQFNTPDTNILGSASITNNLTVSSINGNEVAIPYFTSTFQFGDVTAVAGSPAADLLSGGTFDLLANHHYTAGLSLYYKNEGAGKTATSAIEFLVGKSQTGDPGGVFSAPAGYSGANTLDGANDCFTWDWVQGAETTGATIKMTPVDLTGASDFSTTTMIVGGPNIFCLTDWGAL